MIFYEREIASPTARNDKDSIEFLARHCEERKWLRGAAEANPEIPHFVRSNLKRN
jgi:hypothetical protein